MKIKILTLVLVLAYSAGFAGITDKHKGVIARISAPFCTGSELICERWEGSGTPTDWTDNHTPLHDYDTAPAPLAGNYSLSLDQDDHTLTDAFGAQGELYIGFKLHLTALPASTITELMSLRLSGGTAQGTHFVVKSTDHFFVYHGSVETEASITVLEDTTYYIWIHWKAEVDTEDGVFDLRVGTTGVYASATQHLDVTTGTADGDAYSIRIEYYSTDTGSNNIYDDFKVQTTAIGDMP